MKTRYWASLTIATLISWTLLFQATSACPPPDCGDCEYWDGDSCESECSGSQVCCDDACVEGDCCDDDDCGGSACCDNTCCEEGEACVDGVCCIEFGGECGGLIPGVCCSGICSWLSYTCVECNDNSQCEECEQCFDGQCITILPCPDYTHCDDHLCKADCEETGSMCSFTMPPISSYCGHTLISFACIAAGYPCYWEILEWDNNAVCVIPDCTTVTEYCASLRPYLCYNQPAWWAVPVCLYCACNDTSTGTICYVGTRDACPDL